MKGSVILKQKFALLGSLKQFNFWQNFKPKFLHTWDQTSKKFIMQGGNDSKKVSVKNNLHEFELVMNYTKFFKD